MPDILSFERLASGIVKAIKNGDPVYLPGSCIVDPNPTTGKIYILTPEGKTMMEFSQTDTITNNGASLTGTADEIADGLATYVFKGKKMSLSFDDLYVKAMREGLTEGIEMHSGSVISPTSGTTTVSGQSLAPTEVFIMKGLTLSAAGGKTTVQVTYYTGPNNNSVGEVSHRFGLNNSSAYLPVNAVLSPGSYISGTVRDGDGTTALIVSANFSGIRMTADLDFSADKVMLWIGDSIVRGTSIGGTAYSNFNNTLTSVNPLDHYAFQVRNHFHQRGMDCRLVIKAMGSYTSRMMGYWIKNGWCDIDQCDVIFYQVGTNDVPNTTSQQFTDELDRVIDLRDRKFPNAKVVFVGPTPLNNTTNETALVTLRTLMSGKASANDNIYYVSLATAFDGTVLANYTSSDGIHPNIASNALMAGVINDWVDANNFTF